jgi:predicted TIM-barrel fold metal-dependent hydrolase
MICDSPLAESFWRDGRAKECPVIDMHGHMGPFSGIWFPRETPEAMVRTMDSAGVKLLCFSHHVSFGVPELSNAPAIEAVRKFPGRLRAYMAVNPHYPENLADALARWDDFSDVYVGLKLHPSWFRSGLDGAGFEPALSFAEERGLPVLTHTWGGDPFCGADAVRRAAARHPGCPLLLAHSLSEKWDEAIEVAQEFPNIYLELTAVLDNRPALEMFVEAGLSERLLFGTDLPWFDPHHGIGAVLSAEISDDDRHNILHRNAERLLAKARVKI